MEKTSQPRYTSFVKQLAALVLVVIFVFFGFIFPAKAAVLPVGTSVRMTRQTIGASSNIDVRFQMENGVSGIGDTITLTFATGFSLAAVEFTDVDLLHGVTETSEALAASAANGTWGVAISGQTITFTPPTDVAADEILDGEPVAIRIGTNASGGVNRVVNPLTAGRYEVTIGGGFDGFGTASVVIVGSSAGGFTVGFTVPAAPNGGGGGTSGVGGGGTGVSGVAAPEAPAPSSGEATSVGDSQISGLSPAGDSGAPVSGTSITGTVGDAGRPSGSAPSLTGGSGSGTVGRTTPQGPATVGGGGASPPLQPSSGSSAVPIIPTAPLIGTDTSTVAGPFISRTPTSSIALPFLETQTSWEVGGIRGGTNGDARMRVYPDEELLLIIEGGGEMMSGWIEFEGSRYTLAKTENGFSGTVRSERRVGTQQGTVTIQSGEGRTQNYSIALEVIHPFQIREKEGTEIRAAEGAKITVSVQSGGRWKVVETTALGSSAEYRRYLPSGFYRIEVQKNEWRTVRKETFLASSGALSGEIVLDKAIVNPLSSIKKEAPLAENVARVAEATVEAITQVTERVRTPEAQVIAEIAAPVAIVATVGTTAAAASFNILAYLRFLATQPMLLIRRRRREKWGLVYNAITKQPIDLAIIRLIDVATGAVKQTRITDAQGRFAFLAGAGAYRFQVVKPGYSFPSSLLAKETMDIDLVDLYHGEVLQVQGSATLTPNIPIDPTEKTETPAAIIKRRRWRKIQQGLSIGSLGVAGVAFFLQPTVIMGAFALVQIGAFFLFRRLAVPAKPKNWGIVYDGQTRKPLEKAIVRVFDRKHNKLLETQVTDRDGKYAFFAGKNIYYVTADLSGYERFVSQEIDLRKEALGVIREPLALMPKAVKERVLN